MSWNKIKTRKGLKLKLKRWWFWLQNTKHAQSFRINLSSNRQSDNTPTYGHKWKWSLYLVSVVFFKALQNWLPETRQVDKFPFIIACWCIICPSVAWKKKGGWGVLPWKSAHVLSSLIKLGVPFNLLCVYLLSQRTGFPQWASVGKIGWSSATRQKPRSSGRFARATRVMHAHVKL